MANLVGPVNMLPPIEERIIEFKGLNRKSVVDEGEMSAMENLASDKYPVLAPRKPRGTYSLPNGAVQPLQIITRFERIAMIAKKANGDVAFFYHLTEVLNVTGLTAATRMVAINTKICFFPQKTYVEIVRSGSVVTTGSFGSLEATASVSNTTVTLSADDARINMPSSSHGFSYDDAVNFTGTLSYKDSNNTSHSNVTCNVSCIIEDVSGATLILPANTFIELTGEGATNVKFTGSVSRTMPALDHIIEWNNRLWGVSNIQNTIYACKLGDPKNWQYYQGTSLDSYYAEQGTDEDWTGCAAYSGHLIFFKQNSMCRIYGTAPSNWQITNAQCFGVEEGSASSVAVINDTVFYKSTVGIMAYEGGTPYCISDRFNMKFKNVVGGTEGQKYYASVQKEDNTYELLVLDMDRGVWHREDTVRFRSCCTMDGRLYFICDADSGYFEANKVYIINPTTATESYDFLNWMAVFGPFDEYIEERKIYSKLAMRFNVFSGTTVRVYISINEGEWELVQEFTATETGGEFIPIVPRRCDRYSVKIEGTGNCEIKSLTRRVRAGTGGKL